MGEVHQDRERGLELHKRTDNSPAGRILRGSIDGHVHFAPDIQPRRFTAIEAALAAREMGLRGIVIKSHSYPTGPLASMVSEIIPEIAVFGGICLDHEVGGLNAHAVEASAKLGGKIVWMPVFCSANSKALIASRLGTEIAGDGISLLDVNGKLAPEVTEILHIIKEYDMVLATGHISAREILTLVDKAKQLGIAKIVVTHAMSDFLSESILTPDERQMLAKEGVLIEHCAWQISPTGGRTDPAEVAESIKREGPRNCIMSTDSGGVLHPNVPEGMRMFIGSMLKYGLSEEDVTYMVKLNPARLLGLPPED